MKMDPELQALTLMSGLPERVVVAWKSHRLRDGPESQMLIDMHGLWLWLTEVVRLEAIPGWLESPNDELGGLTPVEVLRRGESDRIRSLIYYLASGMPN